MTKGGGDACRESVTGGRTDDENTLRTGGSRVASGGLRHVYFLSHLGGTAFRMSGNTDKSTDAGLNYHRSW